MAERVRSADTVPAAQGSPGSAARERTWVVRRREREGLGSAALSFFGQKERGRNVHGRFPDTH